jgi:monoamine oxidase
MRVIVVGAGMAGLVAADALRRAGAEVVVVEARDRLGGRTWSAPLGPGVVDLGGAWVHGPVGNPVTEALAAAGIDAPNDGTFYSRMELWADGWANTTLATTVTAAVMADWDPAETMASCGSDSFADGVEWYVEQRGLDGRARELVRCALLWISGALEVAAPPERISLAGVADYQGGGGGNLVPAGGYGSLIERLAEGLDVRLGTAVTRIEHGNAPAAVDSSGGSFEADRVVATVPLGVLKSGVVAFDPPLRPGQAAAVERLEMSTLEKVALCFEERFWPEGLWQITHVSPDRSFGVWFDFTPHVGAPTLVALYNPSVTPELAELPAAERVTPALAALRRMFGSVPEPAEVLTTDWCGDQWAGGSYSYIPLGATADDMRALAEPVSERLLLAGEVTVAEHYGTVEAAFRSGRRAAEWALAAA